MLYTNTFANERDVRPLLLILIIRLARSKTNLKCILKTAVPSKKKKKKHLAASHNIAAKVTTAELLSDVKVIGYSLDKRNLIFLEAILIKNKTPTINSQKEGCDSLLKFFKH